ncbi:hypothetical protein D3C71_2211650 [compost metagenome]
MMTYPTGNTLVISNESGDGSVGHSFLCRDIYGVFVDGYALSDGVPLARQVDVNAVAYQ